MQENLNDTKIDHTNYFNSNASQAKPFFGINQLQIAFSLIGTMIWVFGYAIFAFYKDYLIAFYRKDEKFGRGFYYKYVNYQSYKKLILAFNVFYVFFVATLLLFIKMRYFCILSGMFIFFIGYIGFCIKSYLVDKNKFDLFDEFIWFYQTFVKEKINKFLHKKDPTEGLKSKLD